jgi:signal transduction histidine kinase
MNFASNQRVLLIDDLLAIHQDFTKILRPPTPERSAIAALEQALFEDATPTPAEAPFELGSALQGQEGLAMAEAALSAGRPFALAFVDMRMPPGWDGVETIRRLWQLDPHLQVVICTAYSDYSWTQVMERLDTRDRLLVLKKPFDSIEVSQLARTLTAKWNLSQRASLLRSGLEDEVLQRTGELRRTNTALEAQMGERKRLESQLVQTEKLASLGQLTAGVAHEINNPMGFVHANLGTLETYFSATQAMLDAYQAEAAGLADADAAARLQQLRERLDLDQVRADTPVLIAQSREGIERVRRIVMDLKDFSRSSAAEAWQWSDLHHGIDSTLNIIASDIAQRADVVKEYGDLPEIECQPSHLNQAVLNLLQNALSAMDGQRGTIRISTGRSGSGLVWLDVADSGIGIAPEILPRIFDPFFTTRPVGKGTGLGLSIAYGVVQRHGGRIEVQSTPGAGTVFRILLPVRQPVRST